MVLNGFGTVINSLGRRAKPYLPQVCGTIKWRLNNKSAKIRQQAADLIARIAPVMKACEEEQLLGHLGERARTHPPRGPRPLGPPPSPSLPPLHLTSARRSLARPSRHPSPARASSARGRSRPADSCAARAACVRLALACAPAARMIRALTPAVGCCLRRGGGAAAAGVVLYEYLGEEYPEVLGSILGALKGIVNVIGMTKMTPPIKELLPRLTPILKNRHEKVQENCIDLVGRIADRGASFVPAREWMRICFELLDMLRAHKKAIRRATVNTFGYIAKAIGPQVCAVWLVSGPRQRFVRLHDSVWGAAPTGITRASPTGSTGVWRGLVCRRRRRARRAQDVLVTLLNNLKVQERTNRVCTTVAIAIVAETCAPFTVLPALLNEYRTPELNVQNGVLKALSFMFEYIGEMGKVRALRQVFAAHCR